VAEKNQNRSASAAAKKFFFVGRAVEILIHVLILVRARPKKSSPSRAWPKKSSPLERTPLWLILTLHSFLSFSLPCSYPHCAFSHQKIRPHLSGECTPSPTLLCFHGGHPDLCEDTATLNTLLSSTCASLLPPKASARQRARTTPSSSSCLSC
jgi:hypothetical protein